MSRNDSPLIEPKFPRSFSHLYSVKFCLTPPVIDPYLQPYMTDFPLPPSATKPANMITSEDIQFILSNELTEKQLANHDIVRFIMKYSVCRDIRQAAHESSLPIHKAAEYYSNKKVHAAITKILNLSVHKYGLDANAIVERIKEIAYFDPASLCNPDGSIKENLNDIPPEARRAIKKFKAKNLYSKDANNIPYVTGKLIEVEFWDKLKGNELLGRETDLFKETIKVTHDATQEMKDILLESKARAEQRAIESRNAQRQVLEISATSTMPVPTKGE